MDSPASPLFFGSGLSGMGRWARNDEFSDREEMDIFELGNGVSLRILGFAGSLRSIRSTSPWTSEPR